MRFELAFEDPADSPRKSALCGVRLIGTLLFKLTFVLGAPTFYLTLPLGALSF